MTKQEAKESAAKLIRVIYQAGQPDEIECIAGLMLHEADMMETGDCTFYLEQLRRLVRLCEEMIDAMDDSGDDMDGMRS